jgi:hypothetical protein
VESEQKDALRRVLYWYEQVSTDFLSSLNKFGHGMGGLRRGKYLLSSPSPKKAFSELFNGTKLEIFGSRVFTKIRLVWVL